MKIALIVVAALGCAATVNAADFQIKSRSLGQSPVAACDGAPIRKLKDPLDAMGLRDVAFPASACDVNLPTVAGLKPTGPAKLLFWKDSAANRCPR
ncbi:hypothetical protein [Ramlibacter sp. WS9]|uniref:hypothetical protein n=1 Tax=Ramlibacter sp. WS9 TaxID=1882741 RepID=UPI0011424799|nr:hypothetical protein [Ramlibacter sp. WS9]ROZ77025.1 hypothetical protein EEB15_10600 [Ramlibacter sp. WS9]